MKIEYICHSSVLVNTGDTKIITDPWFNGPAYQQQWNVFPKPVRTDFVNEVSHIALTHGHEDHLHGPTLKLFPKETPILFPYQWKDSAIKYLNETGFENVTEGISFKKIELTKDTSVTYIANSLDAILVIESKGKVLVDLNDALNAHHKSIIKHVVEEIKKKWNKIDYLLCGLGGAGYFPNTVHYPGKNDVEIGQLREQFLAHKFCELVKEMQPDNVISFVPGFVLLDETKNWINDIRFPREKLGEYYKEHFDSASEINFINPFPGDVIENESIISKSFYHKEFESKTYNEIAAAQYKNEIIQYNLPDAVTEERINVAFKDLKLLLKTNSKVYHHDLISMVNFDLQIIDAPTETYYHICHNMRGGLEINRRSSLSVGINLLIQTKLKHLEYSLENEWGGDVFMIGYASEIFIKDEVALKNNLDIISLRLLCRFPLASGELVKNPARGMRFLLSNPMLSKLLIRNKIASKGNPNKLPHNERGHWLNKTKCEVCMACDLPLLSYSLGEELELEEQERVTGN